MSARRQPEPESEAFVTCVLNDWRDGMDTLAIAEKWFPPRAGETGNQRARRAEARICRIIAEHRAASTPAQQGGFSHA